MPNESKCPACMWELTHAYKWSRNADVTLIAFCLFAVRKKIFSTSYCADVDNFLKKRQTSHVKISLAKAITVSTEVAETILDLCWLMVRVISTESRVLNSVHLPRWPGGGVVRVWVSPRLPSSQSRSNGLWQDDNKVAMDTHCASVYMCVAAVCSLHAG